MNRIQVLIVDDHPLFRRGVRWGLEAEPDILVVGEATDGQMAVQQADLLVPDVILIDINMPQMNGLEVTRIIRRRHPQTGVIVLTMHEDDEQLFHAIRVGAAAYCTKDAQQDEIIKLIRRVARGEYLINENVLQRPFVASRVLDQFRELSQMETGAEGVFSPLTPREVEILDCVAQGNSNKEIARILSISDQTVKNHITSILRKLAVNDRTQAVIYALRHGWIRLTDESPAVMNNSQDFSQAGRNGPAARRSVSCPLAAGELLFQVDLTHQQHRRPTMTTRARMLGLFQLIDELAHLRDRQDLARAYRRVACGADGDRIEPGLPYPTIGQLAKYQVNPLAQVHTGHHGGNRSKREGLIAERFELEPDLIHFLERPRHHLGFMGVQIDHHWIE
jgi:DNA-binding NarL/FixJ family response regulator